MINLKVKNINRKFYQKTGFTLVELLISIGIFLMMTAILVAKNSKFDDSITLTNASYDLALAIREAQSSALNVKGYVDVTGLNTYLDFTYGYGINIDISNTPGKKNFKFFADSGSMGKYQGGDPLIKTYTLKRGNIIDSISYTKNGSTCSAVGVDITFKRPLPEANFDFTTLGGGGGGCNGNGKDVSSVEITLKSGSGEATKKVIVNRMGQISVEGN